MDNYIWKYESDKLKYNKFKLDLEKLFDHKLSHCAPVHEEHWAQELTKDIKYCFTSKAICKIADELNDYIERLGLRQ